MNEKINRISMWTKGKIDYPITLEINPTNRCNLFCKSCWQREFDINYDELPTKKLLEVIKEAAELGVKEIRIPGAGEPFTKKGLIEVIKEIKKQKINGMLITNGVLLNKEIIETLIKIRWDCITISIDGANSKTHDYLRGVKGTFEKVEKNLIKLNKLKKEKKSKFPFIRFNTVITNKNYSKLFDIIEFANSVGCEDCQFQPMTVWGKEGKKLELNLVQRIIFQKKLPSSIKLAKKYNINTNLNSLVNNKIVEKSSGSMDELFKESKKSNNKFLNLPCYEPWYNMIILPNGSVAPCSIAGNVFTENLKNKSLKEIWLGPEFSKIREKLLSGDLPNYCKKCCSVVHIESEKIKNKLSKLI